ncbi:MAG TPA: SLC13 family permease, partial [Halobacteriales archaeon]|nr:SLC13 family permease [Halobacteriales archaeon]
MTERVHPGFVLLSVAVAAAVALAPISGISVAGQYALATMAFAGALWITGALPLPVTALLVPVALVVLGVYADFADAVAGFADPVIFLLLAGFVLAEAMQARGLDRRVAFRVLARVGRSPRRLVAGVMVATAGLSMIVSNTATTAMMVPIVVGLLAQVASAEEGVVEANGDGQGV